MTRLYPQYNHLPNRVAEVAKRVCNQSATEPYSCNFLRHRSIYQNKRLQGCTKNQRLQNGFATLFSSDSLPLPYRLHIYIDKRIEGKRDIYNSDLVWGYFRATRATKTINHLATAYNRFERGAR